MVLCHRRSIETLAAQSLVDDSYIKRFEELKVAYFDPLVVELRLSSTVLTSGAGYALVSAAGSDVRVFLDYERGLGHLVLGPVGDARPMCSVDDIAARLPSTRTLVGGTLRLSLEDQVATVRAYWNELSAMFSRSRLDETRAWNDARIATANDRRSGAAN